MATPEEAAANGAFPQIRLITPTGRVQIEELGLRVEAIFAHPDILEYAENGGLGSEPLFGLQGLLVAGIAASRNAGVYALSEEARRATDGLRAVLGSESETLIRHAFKRALGEDGEEGAFLPEVERIISEAAKSVETQALQLTKELKGAGEDGLPQIIEKRVRRAASDVVERILKAALASDGALGVHLQNHDKAVKDLRDDLSKLHELFVATKVAAEHVDPAAAGREWQPTVIAEVARLSLITGDRIEETGDQPAHGRSKKGDAVLHLANGKGGAALRVAIECRTGKERVTLADLGKAKENRAAQATLLLAIQPCALPKDAEELGFRAYWDERAVVLHHDPERIDSALMLATALQVARMFAQLAAAASEGEINLDILRQGISRIEKGLGKLRPLRASATGIETEVGRIRGYAQDIEVDLRGALGELGGLAAA